MLSPSRLYARSQGATCEGPEGCHWCGEACTRRWLHDEPPKTPHVRSTPTARNPNSPWVCISCWLYRRQRVTLVTLKERRQVDKQCLLNHSWVLTDEDVFTLERDDYHALYELLLFPPLRFALSLIYPANTVKNQIQFAVVNELLAVKADTPLTFTLNNQPLTYTIYELEEGIRHGGSGKLPGVRMLLDILGPYTLPSDEVMKEKRERGRPRKDKDALTDGRLVTRKIK